MNARARSEVAVRGSAWAGTVASYDRCAFAHGASPPQIVGRPRPLAARFSAYLSFLLQTDRQNGFV